MVANAWTRESGSVSLAHPELHQVVRQSLAESPYRGLREVDFHVRGKTVRLMGQVRTYFLKQMAQHIVGQLRGIETVENELNVA
jgi:osmotically-inducible protein OsmY